MEYYEIINPKTATNAGVVHVKKMETTKQLRRLETYGASSTNCIEMLYGRWSIMLVWAET